MLIGGLALFLYGMNLMTNGLKSAAGGGLKSFLSSMTSNRWKAMLAGIGITAVIQSSSVTTVLAVGFVSAGLLQFQNTLGIILGANIGTTITAQIIAFKITKAALVIVSVGFLMSVAFRRKKIRETGNIILGLGLVFMGMNVMGEATEPLKYYEPFLNAMQNMDNPLWGILLGAVFTALVQSSSATTGVVIMMASQGLLGIEAGISLVIGANIGTCVTAMLSAIGKPRAAMQVAMSHVLFKVMGSLLWLAFIPQLGRLVYVITPNDLARQVANAHTVFNVVNAMLFIGFTVPIAKLVTIVLPVKNETEEQILPLLDSYYLSHVGLALDMVHQAIQKMGGRVAEITNEAINLVVSGNEQDLINLRHRDKIIDKEHAGILLFLQKLQQLELATHEANKLRNQIEAANILESIADLITTDLVEAANHRVDIGFNVSPETEKILSSLYNKSVIAYSDALNSFKQPLSSRHLLNGKTEFKEELANARNYLVSRLSDSNEHRIEIFRFESEILEVTRRLHSLSRRLIRKDI